jgi:hypothetical protein
VAFDAQSGMTAVGIVFVAILLGILGIDVVLELRQQPPLGEWVATWSRRYPLFATALALVFGAMVGHFFWP